MGTATKAKIIFMKVFSFLLILISTNCFAQTSWDYKKEKTREKFPNFSCTIDSVLYNNETLKGKITFINFWFAACAPCVAEIDALNEIYSKQKSNSYFNFLSISVDDPQAINMFVEKYNVKYPVLYLPKADVQKMGFVRGYPTSIILDKDEFVIYKHSGGSSFKKEANRIVKKEIYSQILQALSNFKN